jgi:hypothetical protein
MANTTNHSRPARKPAAWRKGSRTKRVPVRLVRGFSPTWRKPDAGDADVRRLLQEIAAASTRADAMNIARAAFAAFVWPDDIAVQLTDAIAEKPE